MVQRTSSNPHFSALEPTLTHVIIWCAHGSCCHGHHDVSNLLLGQMLTISAWAPAPNKAAQTASATHAVAIGHLEELVRQGGDHKSERSGLGDASGRGALAPATTSSTAAAVCHRAPPPNALCSRAMGCPRCATGRGRVKSLHDLLRLLGRPFDGRCRVPAAAAVAHLFRHARSTVHTVSASMSARRIAAIPRTLSIYRIPPQGQVQSARRLPCLRRAPPVGHGSRAVHPVSGLALFMIGS